MGIGDKIRNLLQQGKGKAQETAGEARNDNSQIAEGRAEQSKADFKQAGEKAKDAFDK